MYTKLNNFSIIYMLIANLFNKDGLPASPFRTDNLPGKTALSRFY